VRERRKNGRVSHDRWLVSYADFITLLFAFFAMMYAVSSVDAKKLEVAAEGLRAAFAENGVQPPDPNAATPEENTAPSSGMSTEEIEAALRRNLGPQLE
jgi:chemotaxis protein MotB